MKDDARAKVPFVSFAPPTSLISPCTTHWIGPRKSNKTFRLPLNEVQDSPQKRHRPTNLDEGDPHPHLGELTPFRRPGRFVYTSSDEDHQYGSYRTRCPIKTNRRSMYRIFEILGQIRSDLLGKVSLLHDACILRVPGVNTSDPLYSELAKSGMGFPEPNRLCSQSRKGSQSDTKRFLSAKVRLAHD